MELSYIPWWAWIAIAGIFSWAIITTVGMIVNRRRPADDEVTAIRTRLDSIDNRLATVEKAINEIP